MAVHLVDLLTPHRESKTLPDKLLNIFESFLVSYERVARENGHKIDWLLQKMYDILEAIRAQVEKPYPFPPYHSMIRSPIDYYQLGIDFILPLIDLKHSTMTGVKNLHMINEAIKKGHNAILFANHQIEADPQVMSIMLEKEYPDLAKEMIFVAGERVLVDPLAAPFSMGRNLLCIFSKRYIDTPPEDQHRKQLHNKRTMQLMSKLLAEGGKCIYVAPSGGRDRPSEDGRVSLAPFDPASIEMFHLMVKRSKTPTHFIPLSLATYSILPPPESVQTELGEQRVTRGGPIHIHFGDEVDMDHIPGTEGLDKHSQRQVKSDYIFSCVVDAYHKFDIDY